MPLSKKMLWIGLTGGVASGKSSVATLMRLAHWPVVDADMEARQAVRLGSPGLAKVVEIFGTEILGPDGGMDRKKMASLVFSDKTKLAQLEAIIHPIVQAAVKKKRETLAAQNHAIGVYELPLLFEKNLQSQFDGTILVYCDPQTQWTRLMSRDGLSQDEALRRIQLQWPTAKKQAAATWTLDNSGTLDDLALNVESLLRLIQSSCHDSSS